MRRNEPLLDRVPELTSYRDMGCDIHPTCLTCPLPRCRYDEPGWQQREERQQRDVELLQVQLRHSMSVEELATHFGVSSRTVHRILKRHQPQAVGIAS